MEEKHISLLMLKNSKTDSISNDDGNKPGFKNKAFFEQDAIENGEVVTSRCHGSEISGSQQPWSSKYDTKENEKVVRYDFPMQDCTQKQNGSPFFFPSFDNANGRL